MKTRTLLLLSAGCALLILLAGVVFAFQLAGDRQEVRFLSVGQSSQLGDMTVSVDRVTIGPEGTDAVVTMTGVPGESVLKGWRLFGDGNITEPTSGACDARTVVPSEGSITCTVRFVAVEVLQAVAYTRAGEQSQWKP
jgi:hypothetical protein